MHDSMWPGSIDRTGAHTASSPLCDLKKENFAEDKSEKKVRHDCERTFPSAREDCSRNEGNERF